MQSLRGSDRYPVHIQLIAGMLYSARPSERLWMMSKPSLLSIACALRLVVVVAACSILPANAAKSDAPAATVDLLHGTLKEIMEQSEALGFSGRRDRVAPVIVQSFDLPYISRLVLGKHWLGLEESERRDMVDSFTRLTVATYASRFDAYDGERFVTVLERPGKKGRRIVRTELHQSDGERVSLDYLLHEKDGHWRIVNVIADGVSDLSLKRAEYASILKEHGFAGLLGKLEGQVMSYEADAQ